MKIYHKFSPDIMLTSTCFDTYVILREFQNSYFAKSHKFLKLKPLKLQFLKTIRLKYYLVFAE